MSNLIINIRFWYWHLQIDKKFSSIKLVRNDYYIQRGLKGVNVKKIEIYKFFNWL